MSTKAKKPRKAPTKKQAVEQKPTQAKVKEAVQPKEEKTAQGKAEKIARPTAPLPHAMVSSRHDGNMVQRGGRGFSIGELDGAGLLLANARKWGVPHDVRRRTVLEMNVEVLKKWSAPTATAPKPRPAVEKPVAAESKVKPALEKPATPASKGKPKKRVPPKKTKK